MASLGLSMTEAKRYEAYMESRVLELGLKAGRRELEKKWEALRRGWYVGETGFLEKLQARLGVLVAGKRRESHSGGAKRAHGETAAQALLAGGLEALGLDAGDLSKLPKSAPEKVVLAGWLRERTTVSLRWVSDALDMGHYTRVTQAVSRLRRKPSRSMEKLRRRLLKVEKPNE
jgi:hypothetical protein